MTTDTTMEKLDSLIQQNLNAAKGRGLALRNRAMRTQNAVITYRQTSAKLPGQVNFKKPVL